MLVLAPSRCEVPSCIVKAARQSNLVCDGRLVVDAAFRTFDPKILAAGPIAKFSRRSGLQGVTLISSASCLPVALLYDGLFSAFTGEGYCGVSYQDDKLTRCDCCLAQVQKLCCTP